MNPIQNLFLNREEQKNLLGSASGHGWTFHTKVGWKSGLTHKGHAWQPRITPIAPPSKHRFPQETMSPAIPGTVSVFSSMPHVSLAQSKHLVSVEWMSRTSWLMSLNSVSCYFGNDKTETVVKSMTFSNHFYKLLKCIKVLISYRGLFKKYKDWQLDWHPDLRSARTRRLPCLASVCTRRPSSVTFTLSGLQGWATSNHSKAVPDGPLQPSRCCEAATLRWCGRASPRATFTDKANVKIP